ncbi:MAG: S1 RNA-binding domain-containing protein [Eubacteriales bacterium]|nr:S1 RNA-binding domain-containing protein [Eubacteriales bacterium]
MESMNEYYSEDTNTFKYEPNGTEFWDRMIEAYENGETLVGHVTGLTNQGLTVDLYGFKAFMPRNLVEQRVPESLERYLDRELQCRISNISVQKESIVLNRRVVLNEERKQRKRELLNALKIGGRYEGKVVNLTPYGAFIELENGLTGLCHVSQISHTRIKHPDVKLQVGQVVPVRVINVERDRISLSIKALEKAPEPTRRNNDHVATGNFKNPAAGEATTSLADLLKNVDL